MAFIIVTYFLTDIAEESGDVHNETFQQNLNDQLLNQTSVQTNANNFYQNIVLMPPVSQPQQEMLTMQKSLTDLIVKIDNQNFTKDCIFSNTPSQSTFSNGGNLEELLNDIESVSLVRYIDCKSRKLN